MKEDNFNKTLKQEEGHTKKIYNETTTFKPPLVPGGRDTKMAKMAHRLEEEKITNNAGQEKPTKNEIADTTEDRHGRDRQGGDRHDHQDHQGGAQHDRQGDDCYDEACQDLQGADYNDRSGCCPSRE